MAGFLYYLPKFQGTPTLAKLRDMGLGYVFDGKGCQPRGTEIGPDNEGGQVVVHDTFPPEHLGFYRETQKWRKLIRRPADQPIWVGMYVDERRPTPKDLARAEQISGVWYLAEDGNEWLLPTARRWQEFGDDLRWKYNLPTRLALNGDDAFSTGGVLPRYERLWQLAMAYEDAFSQAAAEETPDSGGRIYFTFDQIDALVIECLRTNYRVSDSEVDLLGIYTELLRGACTDALCDIQTRLAWLKKKFATASDGTSSPSGPTR